MAKKRKNPFEDPFINEELTAAEDDMNLAGMPGLDLAALAPLAA